MSYLSLWGFSFYLGGPPSSFNIFMCLNPSKRLKLCIFNLLISSCIYLRCMKYTHLLTFSSRGKLTLPSFPINKLFSGFWVCQRSACLHSLSGTKILRSLLIHQSSSLNLAPSLIVVPLECVVCPFLLISTSWIFPFFPVKLIVFWFSRIPIRLSK